MGRKKQIIVADNDFWDKLKSQHPNEGYKKLCGVQRPHYHLCEKVFGGTYSTGKLAQSVPNPYAENRGLQRVRHNSEDSLLSDQGRKAFLKRQKGKEAQTRSPFKTVTPPSAEGHSQSKSPRPPKKEVMMNVFGWDWNINSENT
ncbi:hypothetical protein O181_039310 [Austropuccinia psidii MF-1]|uniref:Uncharacterized protein n=1 Tax=Austropuccinia psidii MF-1 TaxID=1389203 RepID=A0A9Q3DEP2_9BASI|nr:hypothetical protein [Austropuccinia psidii MF-1]